MTILDYLQQGGWITYFLLFVSIVGFSIMISKFFLLNQEKQRTEHMANSLEKNLVAKQKTPTGEITTEALIELTKQEIALHIGKLERGINTVRIIATVSPLLGLLGTVIGVLQAFVIMSQTGLNNPASFAQGISMALITTVAGLLVAIPHFIGHSYLIGQLDTIEGQLENDLFKRLL